jgi:phosphoribosyl 1,2-cyclic phosphodiesterase
VRVALWGTRGSVGRAGPGTVRYGGDTSSVEVIGAGDSSLVLDAGSGIVHAGATRSPGPTHILLSHLHMDHIQGLGFFRPLFDPHVEVHIWGPVSSVRSLTDRLARYLSPPLFPVRLRDLPSVVVHDLEPGTTGIGGFTVTADFIIHPGQTYGYRIEQDGRILTYMPDHEPALGTGRIPSDPAWCSGYDLAHGANLLIHDAQYTDDEYPARVGWGHSTLNQVVAFAELTQVERLVTFHHEPDHPDEVIDSIHDEIRSRRTLPFAFDAGLTGSTFEV